MGVFEEAEDVKGAIQRRLEVAEHDIDPTGAFGLGGGAAAAGVDHRMRMPQIDRGTERAHAVVEQFGIRVQVAGEPCGQGGLGETTEWLDDGAARLAALIGLHGDHERALVLRATARRAAVALATQIGIVDLHEAALLPARLPMRHGLHQLALQSPGGAVAHPQMAFQLTSLRLLKSASTPRCCSWSGSAGTTPGTSLSMASAYRQTACRQEGWFWRQAGHCQSVSALRAKRLCAVAVHCGHTKPRSQRACCNASVHADSVPYRCRKAGSDRPGWNWTRLIAMSGIQTAEDGLSMAVSGRSACDWLSNDTKTVGSSPGSAGAAVAV